MVDSDVRSEPDLSVLQQDFYIGQSSHRYDTKVINGDISRSRTWQVALMARSAGTLTIPAITVGSERSQPLTIEVREPSVAPPGEADVFITAEVDSSDTYVQAQVLYTIKIYRAVSTRQPALREPVFGGAEVLVELAGDERSYEAVIGGRSYNVIERAFAVFPQESGEVTISPARFEARVLRDGRITGRKVFQSEAQVINVKPIPAPPAEFPDAVWLPARDVTLSDEWSREPDRLRAGEPISRNITISALGQLETQIPVIEPPEVDGVNVYSDKPGLSRRFEPDGIRGLRTDQYAMIASSDGDIVLPGIRIPWWDIVNSEWKVAVLPEQSVRILPSPDAPPPDPVLDNPPEPVDSAESDAAPATTEQLASVKFWKLVAQILGGLWLLTIVGWWWSTRPTREQRELEPEPVHRQQARVLKRARKAAAENDAQVVRHALLEWGRLEWPDAAPRSIGALAQRVAPPLSDELATLSSASYGNGDSGWNGDATARAIRSIRAVSDAGDRSSTDLLPPLMPQ